MTSDHLPTLRGQRIVLRWLIEDDLEALLEIFGDPRVARFIGIPLLEDLDGARELLRDIEDHFRTGDLFQWGVARTDDDRVVGTCTLADVDRTNRRAEVGFVLGSRHWGRGLMSEALPLLFDHAFGSLGLHRLEADVDPRNEASLRLLGKLGFRREGFFRERHLHGDEWQDSVMLGLLATDWKRTRGLKIRAGS